MIINGAGAAGIAIMKLLRCYGVKHIIMCDSKGAIYEGRPYGMNEIKHEIAQWTNDEKKQEHYRKSSLVLMYLLVCLLQEH